MKTIPISCRDFGAGNHDERRSFAIDFVREFVFDVAPHKRWKDQTTIWTDRIRNQFLKLCPDDCDAVPNKKRDWKEYLVDFCWMEKAGMGGRVLLACESEWASDRWGMQTRWGLVEEDFEKLLAIKAPYKVLIFSSAREHRKNSEPSVDFSIDYAKDHLEISLQNYWHHLTGETYILLDFPATGKIDGNGEYDAYIWIAEKEGATEIHFDPLVKGELNRPQTD